MECARCFGSTASATFITFSRLIRMFKVRTLIPSYLLVVILFFILCFPATAGISDDPASPKEITVVSDDNYPPYVFRDENGHLQGILVDEWRLWGKKTGIKVDLRGMDWDKAKKTMAEGDAQVIDTIFFTEERAKKLAFTAPYASIDVSIFFHKDISGINDVKSLRGFTIGVKAGDACIDFLKNNGISTLQEFPSYESIIRSAMEQKVRVFCIDAPPAFYYLYKMNLEKDYRHTEPLYTGQFHRAVPKNRKDLLAVVENGFAGISQKEYEEIRKKWFGASIPITRYLAYIFYLMGALVLLGGILLLWNRTLRRKVTQKTAQLSETINALQKSEEKYRLVVENANEAILIAQDGFLKYVNPMILKILGYSEDLLTARSFMEIIHPEDREKLFEAHSRRMRDEETQPVTQFRVIARDGTFRLADSHAIMISWEGKPATLNYITDITERKRAEEEKQSLEERLQRAEKMEALGLLAGGVAHDLNNVLGIVVGYSEMLLMGADKSSPVRSKLLNIMEGGQKAAAIVQDMLTLARRGVPGRDILNLNSIIFDCQKSPEFEQMSSFHSSVQIKTELEPDLPNITGSSVHLGKTIFNLASNASEAMPKGGVLTIKTANQYLDKPIQGYDEIREGDYVVLSVSDTGEGIPAADLKRIFEPFYTKKVMGRSGTGLGLAVVWGTVKDHNGYINVQSEEEKGSTFTLYFPVTREVLSAEHVAVSVSEYMGKGESILIVDDVKGQRDLAEEMLKKLNYNVSSVSSGEEAIACLRDHAMDLIVLDMIMDPGMDGLDTYRSMLEICPQQKAIIVSGFSETDRVKAVQALGAGAYVKKPYVIEKLGLAVKKELDKTQATVDSPLQTVFI
ncbi:MAG: transporter substrate-binding domain-containing protein [Desulfobacterales bacterium]|nr:transporter substrate-binding domain-containing protein [Desulfobacterales bacterium]